MEKSTQFATQPLPPIAGEPLPTLVTAKAQAKRLRDRLTAEGVTVSHGHALELVAHQHGFRDWNAFHAAIGNRPPDTFVPGASLEVRYLGQPFRGTVLGVEMVRPGWFRLELELEEAVDVVTFDSFSNFRKRIRGVVGPAGASRERTANGQSILNVDI